MNLKEIDFCNKKILEKLSRCLNYFPDCVKEFDLHKLQKDCGLSEKQAFEALLSAFCEFDMDENPLDKYICLDYFPEMLCSLNTRKYKLNPYYINIKIPERSCGNWSFGYKKYKPYEVFVCDDMLKTDDGKIIPKIGYFNEEFRYPCVFENKREWMLITPNEINTMQPAIDSAHGKVLAVGLGLGYFQYMAQLKDNVEQVVIVEKNKAVIELFEKFILPQFEHKEKITIICDDAFNYANTQMAKEKFDFVFVDIWHDVADGFDLYFEFKQYERLLPTATYSYWIERTLLCYV